MRYEKEYKSQIVFPLGGIGTGSIGLTGNGSFQDIEIFNCPNKGSGADFTHFAIKAERRGEVLDARILNTDLQPGYVGNLERPLYTGYGFGPDRGSMAGFPHFTEGGFEGAFPFAELDFAHENFPGKVKLTAFNPFIPTNPDDSSIPAAFFEITVNNDTNEELDYTICLSCNNYYTEGHGIHRFEQLGNFYGLHLSGAEDGEGEENDKNGKKETCKERGDLTVLTDADRVSYQEYWFRGSWFDAVSVFWKEFTAPGALQNRRYDGEQKTHRVFAEHDIGTLAAHVTVAAGAEKRVRFLLSWSLPVMRNTWQITDPALSGEEIKRRRTISWKNYYAVLFEDSRKSALYGMEHFERLYQATDSFRKLLYRSTLPPVVLDAVAANLAVLKSATCLRLEDGSFYGFEGTHAHMGSCEGSCTHVWSYAYGAAYLFPSLERSARTLEYTCSMQKNGGMGFRLQLPLGMPPTSHRPAADGQFGTVMRVYREYLLSGDKDWLSRLWPQMKRTIDFAWSSENPDQWDTEKTGLLTGRQHHTLDMELFGPSSWLSSMYLGGLKAAVNIAEVLFDEEALADYKAVLERGKKGLSRLFQGEYFIQEIDLTDRELLKRYEGGISEHSDEVSETYWNEESGQIKYQIGEGCAIDQVLGQWHCDLLGLGDLFKPEQVKSALQSIYRHNFIPCLREHANPCRIYGLNEESGTIICAYPDSSRRPHIPIPYAEETMHGYEYQAAAHMICRGLEKEGLDCVKAVRSRYDGRRRNPWNEMECGSNYARSLASYSLLLVYSGFCCDLHRGMIGFAPIHKQNARFFWSVDSGFGEICYEEGQIRLILAYGSLRVLRLAFREEKIRAVFYKTAADGELQVSGSYQNAEWQADREIMLKEGEELILVS